MAARPSVPPFRARSASTRSFSAAEPTREKHPRPPAPVGADLHRPQTGPSLEGTECGARAGSTPDAGQAPGGQAPRCGSQPAGGAGGDPHGNPAGTEPELAPHLQIDQPGRIHDLRGPHRGRQRQTVEERQDGAALDCGRSARSREAVPQGQRLPRNANPPPSAAEALPSTCANPEDCLTISPGSPEVLRPLGHPPLARGTTPLVPKDISSGNGRPSRCKEAVR